MTWNTTAFKPDYYLQLVQDFTRLLGALGKRELWEHARLALSQAATRNDSAEAIVVILVVFAAFCTTETCRWKSSPFKWPLGIDCITASLQSIHLLHRQHYTSIFVLGQSCHSLGRAHLKIQLQVVSECGIWHKDVIALGAAVNACAGSWGLRIWQASLKMLRLFREIMICHVCSWGLTEADNHGWIEPLRLLCGALRQ